MHVWFGKKDHKCLISVYKTTKRMSTFPFKTRNNKGLNTSINDVTKRQCMVVEFDI